MFTQSEIQSERSDQPPLSLREIAVLLEEYIWESPIGQAPRVTFAWRGWPASAYTLTSDMVQIEILFGTLPFSAENRPLRQILIQALHEAAVTLNVGLKIGAGGTVTLVAATRTNRSLTLSQLVLMLAVTLLCIRPVAVLLEGLLPPERQTRVGLDQAVLAA